jgi:hypothetical protein
MTFSPDHSSDGPTTSGPGARHGSDTPHTATHGLGVAHHGHKSTQGAGLRHLNCLNRRSTSGPDQPGCPGTRQWQAHGTQRTDTLWVPLHCHSRDTHPPGHLGRLTPETLSQLSTPQWHGITRSAHTTGHGPHASPTVSMQDSNPCNFTRLSRVRAGGN